MMKLYLLILSTFFSILILGCSLKPKKIYGDLPPCMVQKASCQLKQPTTMDTLTSAKESIPIVDNNITQMPSAQVDTNQSDSNATMDKPDFTTQYRFLAKYDLETVSKPIIEQALMDGEDLNRLDQEGRSLLDFAKEEKNFQLIAYLIEQDIDLSKEKELIAYSYDQEALALATALLDRSYKDDDMATTLEKAIDEKKELWIELLRGHGIVTANDSTAFRKAVDTKDLLLADRLIQDGYKLNDDPMLLSYAIEKKNIPFIKYLVAHAYNLNSDPSMLNNVIQSGDYTLADYLIERGCKKNFRPELLQKARATQDASLLHFLMFHGMKPTFTIEEFNSALKNKKETFAQLILQAGIQPNDHGLTALTQAAQEHNVKAMDLLLKHGFDVNKKDGLGRTALMYLVDDINLSTWLVGKGANVNAKDKAGRTVLMYASLYIPVAKMLIQNGADVHLKDKADLTILNYAVTQNNIPLAKLILPFDLPVNHEDAQGKRIIYYSQSLDMTRVLMKYKARY